MIMAITHKVTFIRTTRVAIYQRSHFLPKMKGRETNRQSPGVFYTSLARDRYTDTSGYISFTQRGTLAGTCWVDMLKCDFIDMIK